MGAEVGVDASAACAVEAVSREIKALFQSEPERQSHIYDALNSMPSMHAIASSEVVLEVVRHLLSPAVSVHHRKLLLMAPPEGSWHVPSWHQDWYYNEGPSSTLTLYAPLQPTDLSNGGLTLALGQHPLYPHGDHDIGRPCKWHHIDPRTVDSFEQSAVQRLEPGDVLFFHSLVPHAASVNASNHMRFVVNLRFFDMTDDEFVKAGWRFGNLSHARQALSRRDTR
jgi:ectoine hydroxylase-related dioxygenase (phytanoyl-CoA dioxygenase family)